LWNEHIQSTLDTIKNNEYVFVVGENLVGIHIALFAKKTISQKLTDIATSKVKLGFSGKIGNKGAVCLRFSYEDTSFCFVNCHLDSGITVYD
jgi:hypothetical protein